MKEFKNAKVPGDDIGLEIIKAGIKVLDATAARNSIDQYFEYFPYGLGYYKETAQFMPHQDQVCLYQWINSDISVISLFVAYMPKIFSNNPVVKDHFVKVSLVLSIHSCNIFLCSRILSL